MADSQHDVSNDASTEGPITQGLIVLLRHGQTAWSVSGQHTGRTDIPLTPIGETQAVQAGQRLAAAFGGSFSPDMVYTSPLKRARTTARLAGFHDATVVDGLAEWDYGRAEGRTRDDVAKANGSDWVLWRDGPQSLSERLGGDWDSRLPSGETVHVHNGPGESLEDAAKRASGVLQNVSPLMEQGKVVVMVAHAHILRILTTQWLGLDPHAARLFRLDTAHYSVLSRYRGDNVINHWNC
ncbi:histidine phosphatase family protein [Bifidobacterium crudilactis]|jgi:probable phosphoglycerate mutase|uniref:phosphoglycerate mutase (2,3-diphosphoglycerate-dependent) n=1 Tax=Bifidobacterium crudilactis TaxID=327277 RepID=A0A971CXZ7_9BIFI|nr:histidine phosphatase family protein [Bifidobacterium crudilactis]MDN5972333.1 histidine phosphatase family protein [Bifidobacterium crudilactis]MDN6001626.1 histidine phosphatase family protein [Bifidobacterium crudilactis]MDN6209734.1 histidine phosphatase family protein [Bifidobacterium crudilactis]MDN6233853.1 histidine phosphatase family protein [Bifidobacterium crudilactis]MDN6271115.1 histidine phosphatase family protein [Bifidobacterium crudilactis]